MSVKYLEVVFPCYLGVVTSERAWKAECKRLGIKTPVDWVSENAIGTARCIWHEGQHFIFLCIRPPAPSTPRSRVAGIVAHEAMHAIQYMVEDYSPDDSLGAEMEAYLLQYLVESTLTILYGGEPRSAKPKGSAKKS